MKIVSISFNLSEAGFEDEPFIQEYMEVSQQFDIPKGYTGFELLESISMDNSGRLIKMVDMIHKEGFHCALDGSSSGYSSTSILARVPIDTIKPDCSLFQSPYRDIDSFLIVGDLLGILHHFPVWVVAKGAEDETTTGHMRQHGCDMIQGLYYRRPMPTDRFRRLITEWGEC